MKNIFAKSIDKYGIVNLIIWIALPIIVVLIIVSKQNINTTTLSSGYNYNETTTIIEMCKECSKWLYIL